MRQQTIKSTLPILVLALTLLNAEAASANKQDIALGQFFSCTADGSVCTPDVKSYEQFMAEYAFGIAPKILAPAETLGYSGFYLGFEGVLTPRFGPKKIWETGTAGVGYPNMAYSPALHVRKGLPWSFEIGSTLNFLAQSKLVALGGEVKWALFEGYRHGFRGLLPDIAVRGSVLRVLGQPDIDMSIVGVDGSISYPFGIGGMITLTPYAGFQYYWAIIRVEPLVIHDAAGYHPEEAGNWAADGLPGPNLGRSRAFGGFRIGYEVIALTFEASWAMQNTWKTSETVSQNVTVPHQIQLSGGIGVDF